MYVIKNKFGGFIKYIYTKTKKLICEIWKLAYQIYVYDMTFERYFMHWTVNKKVPNYFKNFSIALALVKTSMNAVSHDAWMLILPIVKPPFTIRAKYG